MEEHNPFDHFEPTHVTKTDYAYGEAHSSEIIDLLIEYEKLSGIDWGGYRANDKYSTMKEWHTALRQAVEELRQKTKESV